MKKLLLIGFLLLALVIPSFAQDDDIEPPFTSIENLNYPNHELLGLVDKVTGEGIEDARRIFPLMDGGAIFTTNRDTNMVLVYKGMWTDDTGNPFAIYEHEPYTNTNYRLLTNNYVFFYKKNNVNVLRITDGSTNHYDISFGTGPLPTNGIPVISYSEVSGLVGANHFVRVSGIHHYNPNIDGPNTISFKDVKFNREPVVSFQLRGRYNTYLMVSAIANTNSVDYYISDLNGHFDGNADVYWSAIGTIDEKSNKIPETDEP